jgi:hypothetical protein
MINKINPKYLSISLLIFSFFRSRSAIGQERKTIKDYFLDLPTTYLRITPGGKQLNRTDRLKILNRSGTIVDINNGYLRTTGDTCFHELAVFKRSKGSPLIAVNTICTIGGSIAIVDPDLRWKDITTQVFPVQTLKPNSEMGVAIKLPRQGKVITIGDDDRNVHWRIEFKKDRFQATKTL